MFIPTLLSLALAAAPALAHFQLNYPPPRGPFVAQMELSFCSGYPTGARSPFPIDGGFVDITSEHPTATVGIIISFDNNPTTFAQFNITANGTSYPPLLPFFTMNWQGDLCVPVDAESVGIPIVNGTNATLQVEFNGSDGALFDCADVVLITNYTIPSGTQCSNSTASSSTSTSTTSSAPTTSPTSSALALPAAGAKVIALLAAVGAAVALYV
ncbi:hypothetical protein CALVIDRAFT_534155 [Calocera viscosa TUFC12733]|uniref:Copper acquisition factor BIM1-like domain-containing protein n=1 Tax=Calocera viscosa (strain TUFC12733) TaxID=1330018 RepID=A0A167QG44_CALVF|nr:hypothetical protein CALVIDRAFT_534155 [Calocera viscosa TUFC12733]